MKLSLLTAIILSTVLLSCNDKNQSKSNEITETVETPTPTFQNKGQELVYTMMQKVGDYNTLREHKDVVYTYHYQTPDGKADISTEKYLFDGELSYGSYQKHERTFADLEGHIEQGYDGSEYWLKHNGTVLNDTTRLKKVAFNRPTNFYWFTMFQKLSDPSVNYEYLKEETINNVAYDVVKVSFQSVENKPTDIYQLYINKETSLVDQFLFTVADFGVLDTPRLMTLQYEEVDGMLLPTKRLYKKSNWNADVSEEPWIQVNWSDIKFNNNLSKDDFKK